MMSIKDMSTEAYELTYYKDVTVTFDLYGMECTRKVNGTMEQITMCLKSFCASGARGLVVTLEDGTCIY